MALVSVCLVVEVSLVVGGTNRRGFTVRLSAVGVFTLETSDITVCASGRYCAISSAAVGGGSGDSSPMVGPLPDPKSCELSSCISWSESFVGFVAATGLTAADSMTGDEGEVGKEEVKDFVVASPFVTAALIAKLAVSVLGLEAVG